MTFSGALTLTDLNDFLTPSQACIKPVEQIKSNVEIPSYHAATQIRIDSSGSYYELPANVNGDANIEAAANGRKLETAQISLNDCLACSGCITSAESVLITLQSHEEVLSVLRDNSKIPLSYPEHKITVLSIAPQSLASLAASVSSSSKAPVTLKQILRRVRAFCQDILGFEHVYDTTFARHISLLEHRQEFLERRNVNSNSNSVRNNNDINNVPEDDEDNQARKLPMLASACPGWICYAEKTHSEMLPFISRTKSPQQIMGTLVKNWLGEKWHKKPNEIYHVTVMPCYDKKLEASRQDFYNDIFATRDVDCVLTTGELEVMMRERGWDLSIPVGGERDDETTTTVTSTSTSPSSSKNDIFPELLLHPGTSSGSYLHTLIAAYLTEETELRTNFVRSASSDYEEYIIVRRKTTSLEDGGKEDGEDEIVFKGATCYGFRNLQNVVRKVGREAGVRVGRGAAGKLGGVVGRKVKVKVKEKEKERGYDYVEVMACPGGCVNGGGQLKPSLNSNANANSITKDVAMLMEGSEGGEVQNNSKWGDREWTKKVESAYWHELPTPPPSRSHSPSRSHLHSREEREKPFNTCIGATNTTYTQTQIQRQKHIYADRLAARILRELCRPQDQSHNQIREITNTDRDVDLDWDTKMDPDAEIMRRQFFRTRYRKVESDVVGLQVKW